MSYKWRLWCDVHDWVYEWSDTPITQCPIENSDPVDTSKTFQVGEERIVIEISPNLDRVRSNYYNRVVSVIYDSEKFGPLHQVKVMSYMEYGLTSYDVEVYDKTNETSLIETNFNNTEDVTENNLGIISNPPEGRVILEINLKKVGSLSKYAYIQNIIFYSI